MKGIIWGSSLARAQDQLKRICYEYKILGIKCIHFHPTWFFKREILDTIGEYNHRDYVEDYDFLCRLWSL